MRYWSRHHGFTLIELMIVVSTLAIIAAIVLPIYQRNDVAAKAAVCAVNKRAIETKVQEYVATNQSLPTTIDPDWFADGAIPDNPFAVNWTGSKLQVSNHTDNRLLPTSKLMNPKSSWGQPLYYNRFNGGVAFRIHDQGSNADNIALFNAANSTAITNMRQKMPN